MMTTSSSCCFGIIVCLAAAVLRGAVAFLSTRSTHRVVLLKGHISEWRDLMFEDAPAELIAKSSDGEPVREVCIFPFPPNDVLLQGETKELCLYEKRCVRERIDSVGAARPARQRRLGVDSAVRYNRLGNSRK